MIKLSFHQREKPFSIPLNAQNAKVFIVLLVNHLFLRFTDLSLMKRVNITSIQMNDQSNTIELTFTPDIKMFVPIVKESSDRIIFHIFSLII